MKRTNPWTSEEVEILIESYSNSTAEEMRKLLPDRTLKSILRKANRLGLKKTDEAISRTGLQSQKKGFKDEYEYITEEILRKLYLEERMSTRDIGEMLNCTKTVILKRLQWYNIPTRNSPSEFTREERRVKWGRPGNAHPLWRGGITAVSNVIRNRVSHVSLERFKMDGFRCTECGGGEHKLNAHHIRPFSEIVAEIREENELHDISSWEAKNKLADICEKDSRLLDISNLITLCEDCHKAVHSKGSTKVS